MKYTVCRVKRA